MYKLFYKIKEKKNQVLQIEKLITEKNELNIQIINFEGDKMLAEINRQREYADLLEKYMKTFKDLKAADEKIKKFEEIKVKSYY